MIDLFICNLLIQCLVQKWSTQHMNLLNEWLIFEIPKEHKSIQLKFISKVYIHSNSPIVIHISDIQVSFLFYLGIHVLTTAKKPAPSCKLDVFGWKQESARYVSAHLKLIIWYTYGFCNTWSATNLISRLCWWNTTFNIQVILRPCEIKVI